MDSLQHTVNCNPLDNAFPCEKVVQYLQDGPVEVQRLSGAAAPYTIGILNQTVKVYIFETLLDPPCDRSQFYQDLVQVSTGSHSNETISCPSSRNGLHMFAFSKKLTLRAPVIVCKLGHCIYSALCLSALQISGVTMGHAH